MLQYSKVIRYLLSNNNGKTLLLLIFFFLFNSTNIFAQTYVYKEFNVEEGLPQSQILSLHQDKYGIMWIGTNGEGIAAYDGKKFHPYTVSDGLVGNYVYAIEEDNKGLLWFGTNNGVSVFDGKTFKNFVIEDGLPHSRVFALEYDKKRDIIWVGTQEGVVFIKNNKVEKNEFSDNLLNTYVFTILADKKGDVWFGTNSKGLLRLHETSIITYSDKSGLYSNSIRCVSEDTLNNLIFVGSLEGLNYYDYKSDSIHLVVVNNDDNAVNTITDCVFTADGYMWVSKYSGNILKYKYINNKLVLVTTIHRIGNAKNIWTMYNDKESNLWIGTIDLGLVQFYGLRFWNYNEEKDGLQNNSVYAICQTKDGNYWVGAKNKGFVKMVVNSNSRRASFDSYTYVDAFEDGKLKKLLKIAGSSVTSIIEAKNGFLWVTTSNGVVSLFNDSLKSYTSTTGSNPYGWNIHEPELSHRGCNTIFQDSYGVLWVGTAGGITTIKNNKFQNFNKKFPVFETKSVFAINEDNDRNLWFVTDSGAYMYNRKNIQLFNKEKGLVDGMVITVAKDDNGNLWFGTKEGVFFYNGQSFKKIDNSNGLSSNNIYLLIFDNNQNLFVGTPKGLDVINTKNYFKTGTLEIRHLGNLEGFIGQECNLNACYRDKAGRLWFGTVKGVTVYDPAHDVINKIKPITRINKIKLDYKDFDWGPYCEGMDPVTGLPLNLVLPYNKNHITFEFFSSSISIPEKVQYQVMLEGLDNDWSPPRLKNEAEYPALPPGTYTFKVRSCNNDGVWMEEPTTFTFTIKPPFWQTWWFYTIIAVLAFLIIYFFVKRREAALKRDKMILEQKVKERTQEVVKQKEIVEQKNKDITDSINYAKNIQLALLPSVSEIKEKFPDSFILYKPRDIVSGDFYWVANRENRSFIAASDCTGHGVPGAFMSMLGIAFLDEIVANNLDISANDILEQLRFNVIESLHQTGKEGESKDGMDMALLVVDWDKNQVQFAGANNPLYLFRNNELIEIKPDKMPIGFHIKKQVFTNHVIDLQPNDTMYLFSDGYADQFGGDSGKKFKYKQFKEVLQEIHTQKPEEQLTILDKTIENWKGKFEQLDDILVIGIQFKNN
ncbi:MAG: SpoIIE family protein phosphatase [Bacteroidales bacterium]|nr:SpoIIE family protein phosphatase [Bacteroidales bacterium]